MNPRFWAFGCAVEVGNLVSVLLVAISGGRGS